jgi:hypothetical protein
MNHWANTAYSVAIRAAAKKKKSIEKWLLKIITTSDF